MGLAWGIPCHGRATELRRLLAGFVGLRQGDLLSARPGFRPGASGRTNPARKVEKDEIPAASGACCEYGGVISAPRTARGVRTAHASAPFLPVL